MLNYLSPPTPAFHWLFSLRLLSTSSSNGACDLAFHPASPDSLRSRNPIVHSLSLVSSMQILAMERHYLGVLLSPALGRCCSSNIQVWGRLLPEALSSLSWEQRDCTDPKCFLSQTFKHSRVLSSILLFTQCILYSEVVLVSPMTLNKLLSVLSPKHVSGLDHSLFLLLHHLSHAQSDFCKVEKDHITCYLKAPSEFFCY